MISYEGLELELKKKNIGKTQLTKHLGFSTRTIAKIAKGERLSKRSIQRIADYLAVDPKDIMKEISDNKILQRIRDEKDVKLSGGIYHELQIRMTYNSNHIEGSKLSEEQTRYIFETNTIDIGDGIPIDDILETVHHFRAIDYVIDKAEELLTEEMIKELHYILKHDTKDSMLSWFAVGDYKKRANMVGGKETVSPEEVHTHMKALLEKYNSKSQIGLEDIVAFHADFEFIHPFQDGNGRVGRLIALKECFKNKVMPFIIEDSKKNYYYRGLSEWKNEPGFLIGTCQDGQDIFKKLLEMLDISE